MQVTESFRLRMRWHFFIDFFVRLAMSSFLPEGCGLLPIFRLLHLNQSSSLFEYLY